MRVALLTPYSPPSRGGIATFVASLSDGLLDRRHDVQVLSREGAEGERVVELPGSGRTYVKRAQDALRVYRPEVVHAHAHWYALEAARRHSKAYGDTRIVFTLHTEFQVASRVKLSGLRRMLKDCHAITSVSEWLGDYTRNLLGVQQEILTTYPAVTGPEPSEAEVARVMTELRIPEGAPLVGFVGPLSYRRKAKGVKCLITAVSTLKEELPRIHLAIVGGGAHRDALIRHAREKGLSGHTSFIEDLRDVRPLLRGLDIYCHVTFQEALGIAILEAMAARRPVIAVPVGGIPEIVQDGKTGVLVSPEPQAVSRAISRLWVDQSERDRLAAAAFKRLNAAHSPDAMVERFLEIYSRKP